MWLRVSECDHHDLNRAAELRRAGVGGALDDPDHFVAQRGVGDVEQGEERVRRLVQIGQRGVIAYLQIDRLGSNSC